MPSQPTPQAHPTRAYVSLSQLAEDVLGLSRARVYELIARGALPQPIFDVRTRRPMFDSDLQRQALTVRQTGVGVDGSAVIFYRREPTTPSPTPPASRRRATAAAQSNRFAELVSSLQGLGVTSANERSVSEAVAQCFPHGIDGQQDADVIRAVFRLLRANGGA